jgi:two-component system sensor histidine kinase/response regulator
MPGMNGFEVCRALRENPAMDEVPIIFLSADDDKNTIVKALESGGVDYVTKPFNKAELLARVRAHLELKFIRDECRGLLQQSERFLEIMAHDLRNWVGSAHFSSLLLEEIDGLPERAQQVSRTIREASGEALHFIDEYLSEEKRCRDEAKRESTVFDLRTLAESGVRNHQEEAAAKEITLVLDLPETECFVKSDRMAISRVLENLLSNALKFSPRGSLVAFEVKDGPVTLTVADEGPGFSEEDRQHLFEPYRRLSARPTEGELSTGLGLSIVKNICDQLEVELVIETPARGARVTLNFPERIGDNSSET